MIWLGNADVIADEIEGFVAGTRRGPDHDRILSTLLFTDIVGATRKAAELGDRKWKEVLLDHNLLIRKELERYRGREIDTAGDGFFAAFDGPARAIQCALEIGRSLALAGIAIRAGVHTGECEVIGEKLGGIAVHVGARITALAEAGEVLVSSTVRDLVAGSGLKFENRGIHTLKGIPGEWNVLAVV